MSINDFCSRKGPCIAVDCSVSELLGYHPMANDRFLASTYVENSIVKMWTNKIWGLDLRLIIFDLEFEYLADDNILRAIPNEVSREGWKLKEWIIHIVVDYEHSDGKKYEVFVDTLTWEKVNNDNVEQIEELHEKMQNIESEGSEKEELKEQIFELSKTLNTIVKTKWTWIKKKC